MKLQTIKEILKWDSQGGLFLFWIVVSILFLQWFMTFSISLLYMNSKMLVTTVSLQLMKINLQYLMIKMISGSDLGINTSPRSTLLSILKSLLSRLRARKRPVMVRVLTKWACKIWLRWSDQCQNMKKWWKNIRSIWSL